MERTLKKIYQNLSMFGINPINFFRSWRAIPYFFRNLRKYRFMHKCQGERFPARMKDFYYASFDRFNSADTATGHYFWQDLWAARYLYDKKVKNHIDVGSRMDGFVAHILPFCRVTYIDYRPVSQPVSNLTPVRGSLLELPLASNSVHSLSCLHVIEHVGLGRYGDPVDPHGYVKAAKELVRILRRGGGDC